MIHLRQRSGSLRMPLRKKSFGCQCSHSWTSCITYNCETFFCPDTPLGGRRGVSLWQQGPDYMENVVEGSISVSGWCPRCEQPRVDGRYPGEMTLFAPFISCSWWLSLLIVFTLPSLMLSTPYNSRTVIRLFSGMSASMRSMFWPVIEVLGRRPWRSFSTVSLPFLTL